MGLADLHMHTTASDGMMSPRMLLNYVAMMTPLDCVAITDHDTLDGWRIARDFRERPANEHLRELDLVPGLEVSTRDGHVLGLWVEKEIPAGLSATETIAAIHEAGGLAVAAHPYAWLPGLEQFQGVGGRFRALPFDAVEVRNSTPSELVNNWRAWMENRLQDDPVAEIGGSDAHFLRAVGRSFTRYPGSGSADLRQAILARETAAGGAVWGPWSLARYVRDRRRWLRFCDEHEVELHDL